MFEPKKVIALAKPGQVAGHGRLISTKAPDPDYAEAAKIAHDNPARPVIVHEFVIETGEYAKDFQSYVHAEVRAALKTLNQWDMEQTTAEGAVGQRLIERYQVSSTTHERDGVVRTWVAYHPDGRPVRTRRRKADGEPEGEAEALAG